MIYSFVDNICFSLSNFITGPKSSPLKNNSDEIFLLESTFISEDSVLLLTDKI